MGFALKVNRHTPPFDQIKYGRAACFTELDTHRSLSTFRPRLSSPASSYRPEQEAANWADRHRAVASRKETPYLHCLIPNLTVSP